MVEVNIVGLDLAKNVFQAHGADASGVTLCGKELRRDQVLKFLVVALLVDLRWIPNG